jgi:vacuolar iron transporter family protein
VCDPTESSICEPEVSSISQLARTEEAACDDPAGIKAVIAAIRSSARIRCMGRILHGLVPYCKWCNRVHRSSAEAQREFASVQCIPLDAPITETAREEANRHMAEHVRGERARIERLSRVRELVLGAQDGLLVPLGVVTGMAAANPGRPAILVAGFAEAVAGAIAMGGGSYLASEAEERFYLAEIEDERAEIVDHPERETAELALALEDEGLPREQAEQVATGLAANPNVFLRTKVQKELGLSPDVGGAAVGDGIVVGLSYLVAAIIPLWPYVVFARLTAFPVSIVCTFVALFGLGVAKGVLGRQNRGLSGMQVLVIGAISAAVGFGIGHLITGLVGHS